MFVFHFLFIRAQQTIIEAYLKYVRIVSHVENFPLSKVVQELKPQIPPIDDRRAEEEEEDEEEEEEEGEEETLNECH